MDEAPKGTPKLNAALVKAQAVIKGAVKDKTNPAFKSKYADMEATIDAVREAFAANELGFRHVIDATDAHVIVSCVVFHSSGEEVSSGALTLPLVQKTPQAVGSALTYGRRYTLQAVAGVAAEDDDGNAASKAPAAAPAGVEKLKQQATAPADGASVNKEMSFRFGAKKGVPISQLSPDDLEFYRGAFKRDLVDPEKAKYLQQNTIALANVESRMRAIGLPV